MKSAASNSSSAASVAKPRLKAISLQMERVAALEAKVTGKGPDSTYVAQARAASLGVFRLVVMGEIKKGKSSFINALTGIRDLVPVHSDVATSTIFKVHHGNELRYTVYFKPGVARDSIVIGSDEVNAYGTEVGNPDNNKQVDFIRVEAPSPILRNGLVIVDTPGVGGLFKHHRDITFKHAPNADAIFFITDSDQAPIGADEVAFLKELRSVTPLVYFVQTKAFAVDAEARAARMRNNVEILHHAAEIPKAGINYFVVDSNMKLDADDARSTEDLTDSGFRPLMTFLNNTLRRNQESRVGRLAIERSCKKLDLCDAELSSRQAVLNANTKEEIDQLSEDILRHREKLRQWDRDTKPKLITDFQRSISKLRRRALDEMAVFRPGGPLFQETEKAIYEAKDIPAVQAVVNAAAANLPAAVSQACLTIGNELASNVKHLVEKLADDAGASQAEAFGLTVPGNANETIAVSTDALDRVVRHERTGQTFETMKTGVYGGLTGATIATVVGGVVGSVVPVVGTMIGSAIGVSIATLWGVSTSLSIKHQQELVGMRREASAALSQTLSGLHLEAQKAVEQLFEQIQNAATDGLQQIVRDTTERLTARNEELQARRHASQSELSTQMRELTRLINESKSIRASLMAGLAKS